MSNRWIDQLTETPDARREFEQERLVLEATEEVCRLITASGMNRVELARKLGVSAAHISQTLSGQRNMTLRTLSDLAWALGRCARIAFDPAEERREPLQPIGESRFLPKVRQKFSEPTRLIARSADEQSLPLAS
jgi:transcriptional regulator with XRE-family HTH domain